MMSRFLILLLVSLNTLLADEALQRGIEAYHSSEYADAIDAFRESLAAGESSAAHHNLALALYREGKLSQSVWHLERAVLLQPNNKQYQFKLRTLRQQLGLSNESLPWYKIATGTLTQEEWIILLSISFWMAVTAFWLPAISGWRVGLPVKALRGASLFCLFVSACALYLLHPLSRRGIVLTDAPTTLRAAPAEAAPQTGIARPGERGQPLDHFGKYLEIETEGGARGWIEYDLFRRLANPDQSKSTFQE